MEQQEKEQEFAALCQEIAQLSTLIESQKQRMHMLELVERLVNEVQVGGRWQGHRVMWHYGAPDSVEELL